MKRLYLYEVHLIVKTATTLKSITNLMFVIAENRKHAAILYLQFIKSEPERYKIKVNEIEKICISRVCK